MKARSRRPCGHEGYLRHLRCYLSLACLKHLLIILNTGSTLVRGARHISFMIFKCQTLVLPARAQLYITAPLNRSNLCLTWKRQLKKDSNLIWKSQWQCRDIHIHLPGCVSLPHCDVLVRLWHALAEFLLTETVFWSTLSAIACSLRHGRTMRANRYCFIIGRIHS